MTCHYILQHFNDSGQAILVQRRAQCTEIMMAIVNGIVLITHCLNTLQGLQCGLYRNSANAQIKVQGVTCEQGTGLMIQEHHFAYGVAGNMVCRDDTAAAQIKLLAIVQIVNDGHFFIGTRIPQIHIDVIRIQVEHGIGSADAALLTGSDPLGIPLPASKFLRHGITGIRRMDPNLVKLTSVGCVVHVTMGNHCNNGLIRNHLNGTSQVADAHT